MGSLEKKNEPERIKDKGNFLQRYWKSFLHALYGIYYCIRYEHNMIIILIAAIVATIGGFYFKVSASEWLFIISMIGSISACEMINSSIEAAVDLTTQEIHPLAKISKDTASSATLMLCITAFIGALIIFLPKIIEIIGG